MKTVADLVPLVIAASAIAEDVPEAIIQTLLRQAVIRFMEDSRVATGELYIDTDKCLDEYLLELDGCQRLLGITTVATACKKSGVFNECSWKVLCPNNDYSTDDTTDTPVLVLTCGTGVDERLYVRYTYALATDACEIPDFIYDNYSQPIIMYTVHMLKRRIGANGLTPELVEYETYLHTIKVSKQRRKTQKKLRMTAPPFLGRQR